MVCDSDDLPFEFRALELALELTCMSLDAQVCNIVFSCNQVFVFHTSLVVSTPFGREPRIDSQVHSDEKYPMTKNDDRGLIVDPRD